MTHVATVRSAHYTPQEEQPGVVLSPVEMR
jgi:hypothetical protein